jgi:hypothetical protein
MSTPANIKNINITAALTSIELIGITTTAKLEAIIPEERFRALIRINLEGGFEVCIYPSRRPPGLRRVPSPSNGRRPRWSNSPKFGSIECRAKAERTHRAIATER